MSTTNNLGLNASTIRATLPALTGLLNLLAVGGGLYDFYSPSDGAKGFGIAIPDSQRTPTETALIKVHGIRNIGVGIGGLISLTFLQYSDLANSSPAAAQLLRRVIGISLLFGTIVGFGDSYILAELSKGQGLSADTIELARGKSTGHALMTGPVAAIGLAWLLS